MGFFSSLGRALFGEPTPAQDPQDAMLVEFPTFDPDKLPEVSQYPNEEKRSGGFLGGDPGHGRDGALTLWPPDAIPTKGLSAQLHLPIGKISDPTTEDWTRDALLGFKDWNMFSTVMEDSDKGTREIFAIIRAKINGKNPSHVGFYRFGGAAATLFRRSFKLAGPLHLKDSKYFSCDGTLAVHHLVTQCNEHIFDKERMRDFDPQFKMRSLAEIDGLFYSIFYHNSDKEALLTDTGNDFLLSFQRAREH